MLNNELQQFLEEFFASSELNRLHKNYENKCYNYEQKVSKKVNQRIGSILKPHYRRINGEWKEQHPPVGCAFCQFNVPCMDKNLVVSEQEIK